MVNGEKNGKKKLVERIKNVVTRPAVIITATGLLTLEVLKVGYRLGFYVGSMETAKIILHYHNNCI